MGYIIYDIMNEYNIIKIITFLRKDNLQLSI